MFIEAISVKTYDFSTLYTSLELEAIYENLKQLILRMFKNSGSTGIWVSSETNKSFWSDGSDRPNYTLYTIDKLLDSLRYVLYNTYIQFAGNIFLQTQGIPMGGNASPFIADLFLAWQEFCFMERLIKSGLDSDLQLAKKLSNNSRYLDDIAVLNYLGFGAIAKSIYHHSCILEESQYGYLYDHFLDLNVRIRDKKFIIGIYHKVDDFNFEVISFPFPCSNIHSQIGYSSFYSQLVRYFRLCNNITDFIVRVKMLKDKLSNRGYLLSTLKKYFLRFCTIYPAPYKYGSADSSLWEMTNGVVFGGSCCIYDQEAVKNLVKPCFVRLEGISQDQMEKLGMCNSMPSDGTVDLSSSNHSTESDTSPIPIPLINSRNHCYLNSVLQVLFRIKDILFTNLSLNNCPEGKIVDSLFTSLNSNSEAQMASFKNDIAFYKQFYDGKIQRDVYECFQGILTIMHLGTRHSILGPDGDLSDDDFVSSITKSGFSFTLKKTLTCLLCSKSTEFFIPSSDYHIYLTNLESQCPVFDF